MVTYAYNLNTRIAEAEVSRLQGQPATQQDRAPKI
jgi:hypothetical protein